MINPFLLSPKERLQSWKELRETVSSCTDEDEALRLVAEYWAMAPISAGVTYDPEDCSEWLSPWEMVHYGDWCMFSVAIGMEFTLRLSGWDKNRLVLRNIRDYDISEHKMILEIDNNKVLNYIIGQVVDRPYSNHDILISFVSDGKKYCKKNINIDQHNKQLKKEVSIREI